MKYDGVLNMDTVAGCKHAVCQLLELYYCGDDKYGEEYARSELLAGLEHLFDYNGSHGE